MPRTRTWAPFTSSSTIYTSIAAGAILSLDLASILEAELAADLAEYTTQRIIFSLSFIPHATTDLVITVGLKYTPEHLAVANQQQPASHPSVDWQYWEAIGIPGLDVADYFPPLHRDVAISRRMRQADQDLEFLIENPSGNSVLIHLAGRVLLLRS